MHMINRPFPFIKNPPILSHITDFKRSKVISQCYVTWLNKYLRVFIKDALVLNMNTDVVTVVEVITFRVDHNDREESKLYGT